MGVYECKAVKANDYVAATETIYSTPDEPSHIRLPIVPAAK